MKCRTKIHVRVVVHVDSENGQPLRRVLGRKLHDHGIFVPTRLTPGGPEGHQNRFAAVLSEKLLVAGEIDELQGRRGGGL